MSQGRDQLIDILLGELGKMAFAAREYLTTLTGESKVRTALMLMELEEAGVKAEQAEQETAKASGAVGMMRAPYGYCATCGVSNVSRKRDLVDPKCLLDTCLNGHEHRAADSRIRPPDQD